MIKTTNIFLLMLIIPFISACTVVPGRFNQLHQVSSNGGYVIESENTDGFYLEVFYKSYSFVPNPDDNIQEAKKFFIEVAKSKAKERGKNINPILTSKLNTNSSRNIIDGYYAIYVSGFVSYVK